MKKNPTKVVDVMSGKAICVPKTTSLEDAAKVMAKSNIGFLVVGTPSYFEGCLTDRDIVCKAVASGFRPDATEVAEIMTPVAKTCKSDDEIQLVANAMAEFDVSRLVVVDDENICVGVITHGDLLRHGFSDDRVNQKLHRKSA